MSTGLDMSVTPARCAGFFDSSAVDLSTRQLKVLRFVESSARVKRWHAEPTLHIQSVGEHTYSVMQLILLLDANASRNLLIAALMHDTAERKFGDIPGPTKKLAGLKEKFDGLEDDFMASMGLSLPELNPEEAKLLKMCDMLEGAMFAAFELRRGNREIREGFFNYMSWLEGVSHSTLSAAVYNQLLQEYTDVFGK